MSGGPMQSRADMAREWRARAMAERDRKRAEATAARPTMHGNCEMIHGRIPTYPGELPGIAPVGSSEHVNGVEESQELTRPVPLAPSIWGD